MLAAKNGDLDGVTTLIDLTDDINAKNNNDETALMLAAKNGHKNVVKLLIDEG